LKLADFVYIIDIHKLVKTLKIMAVKQKKQRAKRSEVVNIRVEPSQRDLIDAAASSCGKTRSAFILDAATVAAQEALLDRRLFFLDDEQWEAFNEMLDAPPQEKPQLRKLLTEPGIFD
jgi:uncharacterized protein (DUF1778 family)